MRDDSGHPLADVQAILDAGLDVDVLGVLELSLTSALAAVAVERVRRDAATVAALDLSTLPSMTDAALGQTEAGLTQALRDARWLLRHVAALAAATLAPTADA